MDYIEVAVMWFYGKVLPELESATKKFGKFNSAHEGKAVIEEELEEMWDDIKANKDPTNEAVQVAAMGIRFLIDICSEEPIKEKGMDIKTTEELSMVADTELIQQQIELLKAQARKINAEAALIEKDINSGNAG